ncbi:hypothetical protein H310_02830 [Aphanomyces invadans]|uniref:Uncharacterized protein n=1 Tax=Aphanomyces invadans TaxID=157072 RepID=A0A024UK00_9STRA|nr:hypothetical protein H310_02830 [Aphanomyces invadans]ETW06639.1 hypothetical protein H310_02830 [Aphanomyces invadans]|eukprot:XP_008864714.1 hypothetical protein H310_02830 [Aphanomyces invadans]
MPLVPTGQSRFLTPHKCCQEELFASDYIRTNKSGGLKSLRCFPHCCKGHNKKTFCGTGVGVECDMPDCTAVLSYFSCNGDPGSTPDKDECPVQFQVGLMYDLMEFESHVKSKDNLFGSVFPGQRVGSSQQFIINGDRQCWHYGWCSSRVGQKYTHCLKVFFFKHLADKKLECIDSIESDAFHITSSRVLRKKSRLAKRSLVEEDAMGGYSSDKAGSSSGHSDTNHSKRAKSTKRDLTCLLNPNEAANVVARPSPDASRAPIGLLPQPSLLPLVDIATPSGRPSAPHHQMQLHNRSNDVFFIIQILSRIADFERVPHTCQYFSLTMHHLFSVQPLLAKPPPSPPRIPHGSVMESLLSVLVTGVETALERGFLTKLRDHILTHPHDALQAYSDMLALFEHELLALGRRFPQPCDAVSAMAAQLRHAFANVLGDKHKGLVPEHVYIPDTPPTNVLDSLYMGKEFAASVLSAVHVPQWSPTSRNVQGDFSPLSGKWTRLSLQCRTQPQHHPSWLYRLLTDVASRTWSIDDRGDEMLILWPGSVGTSHLIHKLCGKHRLLAQSPYGLSSSCTQLIGYLAKRNFQDNTITLEYYYWPADAASKFRKRLTRHFRMHPDDANLLEIHVVLEVCKPPPDNQLAKTPMERLTFPADWHVESSSIDTYARVVDRV